MAEEEKNARTLAKRKFTNLLKSFKSLATAKAEKGLVKTAYDAMIAAYDALETANDSYIKEAKIDLEQDADAAGYMDQPGDERTSAILEYSKYIQEVGNIETKGADDKAKLEEKVAKTAKFDAELASLEADIKSFGGRADMIRELSEGGEVSVVDMRLEVTKIEDGMEKLMEQKRNILKIDPTRDIGAVVAKIDGEIVADVQEAKKVAMKYVKEKEIVPPAPTAVSGRGGGGGGGLSSTKKEQVNLPKFSGNEKTAYHEYPVWKKQWDLLIAEYPDKFRAGLLREHLDSESQKQIIGVEDDYVAAIKKLEKYYGDPLKVVHACTSEISSHSAIAPFDYKAMVAYKNCLVNNYRRLVARGLEHELSTTQAM